MDALMHHECGLSIFLILMVEKITHQHSQKAGSP